MAMEMEMVIAEDVSVDVEDMEMWVVPKEKAYTMQDMVGQTQDRKIFSVVFLSIPIAKEEEETTQIESDTHATKTEGNSCFEKNIVMHYNQDNMVQVQQSYVYLRVAMISVLP